MLIHRTDQFDKWLEKLRDARGRAKIIARIDRLGEGNPGDSRGVGSCIVELKIDFGPGYRIYYTMRGAMAILLLCGGDKNTQTQDIKKAKLLAAQLE